MNLPELRGDHLFPTPKEGDLRLWWIPQIPAKPFLVPLDSEIQGHWLMGLLARYDLYQLAAHIKPDYANVGGLEVFRNGEWEDYTDDEDDECSPS